MKIIYQKYLEYLFFVKKTYKRKSRENSVNSLVLAVLILFLNLHSLAVIIEFLLEINLGLKDFWTPHETPKVVYGYIFGGIISILLAGTIIFIENYITKVEKVGIIRNVIKKRKSTRIISFIYILGSFILFLFTTVWMMSIMIPKGGI